MRLREMTGADIPAGLRLKEVAGWNQTAADWQRFLDRSPHGCFVAEMDGQVRGTVTTIPYERCFAWIGMVLVDPGYRGRGFGTALLERAIEYLDGLNLSALKLDATPQGKPLYEKLGFRSEYEIGRWTLRRGGSESQKPVRTAVREPVTPELLERVCRWDREVFGADHPYAVPPIGLPEQLDAITLDDVRAFARTYYRPNNATVVVCGAFDKSVITYCGGGIAASATAHALVMLGHPDVKLYDASMSEWAIDPNLPMETG